MSFKRMNCDKTTKVHYALSNEPKMNSICVASKPSKGAQERKVTVFRTKLEQ